MKKKKKQNPGGLKMHNEGRVVALKECVADLTLENRLLKKSMTGAGEFEE